MKKKIMLYAIHMLLFNSLFVSCCYCQSAKDAAMIANSEKWNVTYKKGTFTLSQPGSAQTFTMNLIKLDSGITKYKKKDSSEIGFFPKDQGMNWDQRKYITVTKKKVYKLQDGNDKDSTRALFSAANISKQKKQTVFGKMISKNDEGENEVLSDSTMIDGIICGNNSTAKWQFSLNNINAQRNYDLPFIPIIPVEGFIKNEKDSLFFQPSSFNADAVLINTNGDHLAAVKFRKKPFIIWARKDIDNPLQHAIAVLFGVMIAMKQK